MRLLGLYGNKLQIVAADTLNESAAGLEEDYKRRLRRKQIIRTKFTLNSVKTFKATAIRSTGEPRPLGKINAITGVRKMRGGVDHYLAKLDKGNTVTGNPRTRNRVPVPLDFARTGRDPNKPITGKLRLTAGKTQTLRTGGKKFGVGNDGYTPARRFAILYNHRRGVGGLTGDLSKPFFFVDNQERLGIFKFFSNKLHKIRSLAKSRTRTRPSPNFESAVKALKPSLIQSRFVRKARNALKGTTR